MSQAGRWRGVILFTGATEAAGAVDVMAGKTRIVSLGPGDLFGELESFCELPPGVRHVAHTSHL